MLTREISTSWLPDVLASDAGGARLDVILAGVFWEGSVPVTNAQQFDDWFLPWQPAQPASGNGLQRLELKPSWEVQGWKCYAVSAKPVARPLQPGLPNETQQLGDYDDDSSAIARVYLDDIRDACWPAAGAFKPKSVGEPQRGSDGTTSVSVDESSAPAGNEETVGWLKGYIGNKATSLPPLNARLGLAWITQVVAPTTPLQTGEQLVVFPVFRANQSWQSEPAADPKIDAHDPHLVRAEYAPIQPGGERLQVICRSIAYPRPNDGSIPSFNVKPATVTDTAEWLSDLASNAAPALDLAGWLVEWLKRVVSAPRDEQSAEADILRDLIALSDFPIGSTDPKEIAAAKAAKLQVFSFLKQLRKYLLFVSRDLCGLGCLEAPDQTSLVKAIWNAGDRSKSYDHLKTKLQNWDRQPRDFIRWWFDSSEVQPPQPQPPATGNAVLQRAFAAGGLGDPAQPWPIDLRQIGKDPDLVLGLISSRSVLDFIRQLCTLLDSIRDPRIARLIIAEQWAQFVKDASYTEQPVTTVLAGIGDPIRFQARSLIALGTVAPTKENYWRYLFPDPSSGITEETRTQVYMVDRLHECLTDPNFGMWTERLNPMQVIFYPQFSANDDPLQETFGGHLLEKAFNDFMGEVFQWGPHWQPANPDLPPPPKNIPDLLFPHMKDTYPAPPPVRVQVFRVDAEDRGTAGSDQTDNRAGVVLYCAGEDSHWAALNRVRVDIRNEKGEVASSLKNTYLVPSPISGQDGLRHSYRRFSNENPGIIASPDIHKPAPAYDPTLNPDLAAGMNGGQAEPAPPRAITCSLPAQHHARSLHYGKSYNVAAAWITNAGVLPPKLRFDPTDARFLTVPAKTVPKDWADGFVSDAYAHRRRVPVGAVRFSRDLKNLDPKRKYPLFPVPGTGQSKLSTGGAVRPLACDLPEWSTPSSGKDTGTNGPNQSLLLLFPKEAVTAAVDPGQILVTEATYTVCKPTAPFWDWFAWRQEWDTDWTQIRKSEWLWETCARNFFKGDEHPGPLDDPAVEEYLCCEVEELFPNHGKSVQLFARYSPAPLRGAAVPLDVSIAGAGNPFDPTKNVTIQKPPAADSDKKGDTINLTIPQGTVVKLTLWSLVDDSEFSASGRFHDFMKQLPGAKSIDLPNGNGTTKKCWAFSPVELWVEGARAWDAAFQNALANPLWQALRLLAP